MDSASNLNSLLPIGLDRLHGRAYGVSLGTGRHLPGRRIGRRPIQAAAGRTEIVIRLDGMMEKCDRVSASLAGRRRASLANETAIPRVLLGDVGLNELVRGLSNRLGPSDPFQEAVQARLSSFLRCGLRHTCELRSQLTELQWQCVSPT